MAILSAEILEGVRTAEVQDFTPLPKGDYTLQVAKTALKPTKDGRGQYINVEFTVLGPKYQGRKLFTNFNVLNSSAEATRIGRQQLKSLILSAGVPAEQVTDTEQLIGMTCGARVDTEENEQYGAQNRIKRFMKPEAVSQASGLPDAFTTIAPASSDEAPWFN